MNSDFEHPLLPRGKAIRILTLLPGCYDDQVRCATAAFPLGSAPTYHALSYTWGTENDPELIELNGRPFLIRKNLWCFLRRLRQSDGDVILWCDMVCIDQNNLAERGHQVRSMGDVYRQASSVWIWLGEETEASIRAFRLLRNIYGSPQFPKYTSENSMTWSDDFVLRGLRKTYGSVKRKDHEKQKLAVADIFDVLERDYWSRVWILQEVVLAEKAFVHCGGCVVPWYEFWGPIEAFDAWKEVMFRRGTSLDPHVTQSKHFERWAVALLAALKGQYRQIFDLDQSTKDTLFPGHGLAAWTIHDLVGDYRAFWELTQTLNPWSIMKLLQLTKTGKCADPRDRIYGILAIARDVEELEVDYDFSTTQVFIDVLELFTDSRDFAYPFVAQLATALRVNGPSVHSIIIADGQELGSHYRYDLVYPFSVLGVESRGLFRETWMSIHYEYSGDATTGRLTRYAMSSSRKNGSLALEPDPTHQTQTAQVGDRLFLLSGRFGLDKLGEPFLWDGETYCILKREPSGKQTISFHLRRKRDRWPITKISKSRQQKITDFYSAFYNFGNGNLVRSNQSNHHGTLCLSRRQHLLLQTIDLK